MRKSCSMCAHNRFLRNLVERPIQKFAQRANDGVPLHVHATIPFIFQLISHRTHKNVCVCAEFGIDTPGRKRIDTEWVSKLQSAVQLRHQSADAAAARFNETQLRTHVCKCPSALSTNVFVHSAFTPFPNQTHSVKSAFNIPCAPHLIRAQTTRPDFHTSRRSCFIRLASTQPGHHKCIHLST